ncbi:ELAV-like protein 2 [Hypsibius exemplaris]|uniref:ELAV-like protein 2 n=1 Tax=Hypsibius exemplaris TaxID=2072580 RepID=A0A1W0X7H4_HYPEX|nr:ELAV-like protein 2 [Hypsibius exemplaris]
MSAPRKSPANQQRLMTSSNGGLHQTSGHHHGDSSDEGYQNGGHYSTGSTDDLAHSNSSGSPPASSSQQSDAGDISKTNLIVNYLPQGMELETMRKLFENIGPVESCKLIKDRQTNQSLGFGFVNYISEESAVVALRQLNGIRIQNKNIKVSYARKSSESIKGANLYVSGFPKSWVVNDLEAYFQPYGEVITARILIDNQCGLSKGVGFVRFDQKGQADRAIEKLHGRIPPGQTEPIQVKFANNPSAAATAIQAASAAAAAAAVCSPASLGAGRFNFGSAAYPAMTGGFIPALAAFMQTGGLNQGGLGLNPFGMLAAGQQMASPVLPSSSSHRSRISPVGPIHHQTTPRMRYSPMGTGDVMSSLGMGAMSPMAFCGLGGAGVGSGQQANMPVLFVYNLPSETEDATLWQLFGQFGPGNVKIVKDATTQKNKGYAFITMTSYDGALCAITALNGYQLGNRVLQVSFKTGGNGSTGGGTGASSRSGR